MLPPGGRSIFFFWLQGTHVDFFFDYSAFDDPQNLNVSSGPISVRHTPLDVAPVASFSNILKGILREKMKLSRPFSSSKEGPGPMWSRRFAGSLSGPMMSARELHRLDLCPARFCQCQTVHFRESWAVNDVIDPFLAFWRPKVDRCVSFLCRNPLVRVSTLSMRFRIL